MPSDAAIGYAGTSFTITGHPTSLTGYYKFAPQNGETMKIFIFLYNANWTQVSSGTFQTTTSTPNWTSFNISFSNYATAVNVSILIAACNVDINGNFFPQGNSVLNIDNLNFDNLIGISEISKTNRISVYPNPSSGIFAIKREDVRGQMADEKIEIHNILGEKVYHSQLPTQNSQIDLSNQPNGIYFINIKTEQGVANKKLIIQK